MAVNTYKMTKNEKRLFFLMSILLLLFIVFMIFYHITDMTFYEYGKRDCGLKMYFHLYCPGCGGTRAVDAFLHGRLIHSLLLHPTILYLFVFFLSYYIPSLLLILGIRKKPLKYVTYLYILCGMLAVIVVFFVVRNLLLVCAGYDYIGECLQYWS